MTVPIPSNDLNERSPNRQGSRSASGFHSQALLATLAKFIEPLFQIYASPSEPSPVHVETAVARACCGIEGQELLAALQSFVKATLAPPKQVHVPVKAESGAEEVIAILPSRHSGSHIGAQDSVELYVPKKISSQELPLEIIETVYKHVHNEMPIRVLAFSSNGTRPRLLECNAIIQLVLSGVAKVSSRYAIIDHFEVARLLSRYAILSHTWIRETPGDVVYGDWATRELPEHARGFAKIARFCQVAAKEYGVSFGWMDTVCINKESSRELDESIRSMHRWYRDAHVCVAYMSETADISEMHTDSWFTRGWTLQELLAPKKIKFYDKDWVILAPNHSNSPTSDANSGKSLPTGGTDKHESRSYKIHPVDDEITESIQDQIYKATTITKSEMNMFRTSADVVPISRTMQLAATRKVTRAEDKIYSLMGLLGVEITIAYGEGPQKAFIRLIREIMVSKDHFLDIFNHTSKGRNLIPRNVEDYLKRCSVFDRTDQGLRSALHNSHPIEPILLTHLGVRIPLLLVPAFKMDIYKEYVPDESVSLELRFANFQGEYHDYILLRDDQFAATWIDNLTIEVDDALGLDCYVVFFGILNFWTNNGSRSLWVPPNCMTIPINPGLGPGSWKIGINPTRAEPLAGPMVLSWSDNDLARNIENSEMQRRGFRVETLHLK